MEIASKICATAFIIIGFYSADRFWPQYDFEAGVSRLAIPKELEPIRNAARWAINPLKPADASTKAPNRDFLFTAVRSDAGRSLPPYYLVYFLLVDLLGFKNLGQFEKVSWSIPVDLDGVAYLIEHRKFGVGVFIQNKDTDEPQAQRIVSLVSKGVRAAAPFFKWMAEAAIQNDKLNVQNASNRLFARFLYFRDAFLAATVEATALRKDDEAERKQRELSIYWYRSLKNAQNLSLREKIEKFKGPAVRASEKASWLALGVIDAFFSWTENVFIHIAILQGNITTGSQLKELVGAEWGTKYKAVFDLSDKESKKHFDELSTLRRQLRNFVAHGAFGKEGKAFHFHSGAGAVPVVLDYSRAKPQFSLSPKLAFEDETAIIVIGRFVDYLWTGKRAPARIYIEESELPLILTRAADGSYAAAMTSVDDMREFVEHLQAEFDRAADMDW